MKVGKQQSQNVNNSLKPAPKKLTQEQIQAKIKTRFGDKAVPKKPEVKSNPKQMIENGKKMEKGEAESKADLAASRTDKLRAALKTGSFAFNEKERKALGEILKLN